MNSCQKGKRGERLLAAVLTAAGFPARRGQQFSGGTDSPDIVCPALAQFHWEAKFVEAARIQAWLNQVEADSAGKPWVIAWKRSRGPWLALVELDTLLDLMRQALTPQNNLAPAPASRDADLATAPTPTQTHNEPTAP